MHITTKYNFSQIWANLNALIETGDVNYQTNKDGLIIFCYSKQCVYNKNWNDFTKMARGLILDPKRNCIVARPFEKFFNYGEVEQNTKFSNNFEVTEKLDGSLIILFYYNGHWQTATKGSFYSEQAKWAENYLNKNNIRLHYLNKTSTYLLEATYPENRIVIPYDDEKLSLLAAYDYTGEEYTYSALYTISANTNLDIARKYVFKDLSNLIKHTATLPFTKEGFVIRFDDGLRIKLKGDEYCRLHRAISKLTPLNIWNLMLYENDLTTYRAELPEEYWEDFDNIYNILNDKLNTLLWGIQFDYDKYNHFSNKELGLYYKGQYKAYLFTKRNGQDLLEMRLDKNGSLTKCPRKNIFNLVRPTGNKLQGYVPSSMIKQFEEEQT